MKNMKALLGFASVIFLAGCSKAPVTAVEAHGAGSVVRLDPALDAVLPPTSEIEKVAGGFEFTEGPLWRPDGHLWFSDVTGNVVRSLTPSGQVKNLILNGGGERGAPPSSVIGPNGMVADKDGYVLLCQHTNRRIVRVDKNLETTAYLEKFEGKRF